MIALLEDTAVTRERKAALDTLRLLPCDFTRDVDFESEDMRSRLLARLRWYSYRLHLRVERLALYWFALPYRPSGPGHARDVMAWGRMIEGAQIESLVIITARMKI